MALREFTDSQGRKWRAWDVSPYRVYPRVRAERDRRVRAIPGYQPERRVRAERRRKASLALDRGWVCFESGEEKRRIVPPPPGWADVEDGELEALCRKAAPATRSA